MIQLVWLMLLAVHTGAAAVWWWMMPGGFSSAATEYWVNQVLPLGAVAVLLTALFARGKLSETVMPPVLAAIPVFWMAFGISARITFDDSFRSSWTTPFLVGAGVAALWVRQFRFRVRARWLLAAMMVAGAVAGWTLPGTQRAPAPATSPSGTPLAEAPDGRGGDRKVVKLSRDAQVRPDDGRVVVRRDALVLN